MRKDPPSPKANVKSKPQPLRDNRPRPATPVKRDSKTNRSPAG